MITCTQKTQQELNVLTEVYDMSVSQVIKMLVAEKAAERK